VRGRRSSGRAIGVHVDMTPMVDVMMLLVIFFMMTTAFVSIYPGFEINLPQASVERQDKTTVEVLIAKDGRVAVDGKLVGKGEMKAALSSEGRLANSVSIRADKEASHGMVVAVMDEIHKAGVTKMAIAVEEKGRQ